MQPHGLFTNGRKQFQFHRVATGLELRFLLCSLRAVTLQRKCQRAAVLTPNGDPNFKDHDIDSVLNLCRSSRAALPIDPDRNVAWSLRECGAAALTKPQHAQPSVSTRERWELSSFSRRFTMGCSYLICVARVPMEFLRNEVDVLRKFSACPYEEWTGTTRYLRSR